MKNQSLREIKSNISLHKVDNALRAVSYNIVADFFDNKDPSIDKHHHWAQRSPYVKKFLESVNPDVICLQELSPDQASELNEHFYKIGYKSVFLSHTPSDIDTGAIAFNSDVANWQGKFIGTFLTGIFISPSCEFLEVNRFWLNDTPDTVPISYDRG